MRNHGLILASAVALALLLPSSASTRRRTASATTTALAPARLATASVTAGVRVTVPSSARVTLALNALKLLFLSNYKFFTHNFQKHKGGGKDLQKKIFFIKIIHFSLQCSLEEAM